MATSNFKKSRYFDLYATDIFDFEYLDENDEPTGEWEFAEWEFNDCVKYIDEHLNTQLEFFKITLESGYYSGVQTIIVEDNRYSMYDDPLYILEIYDDLDGKEIYNEYGFNKYILKRKIEKEIKLINDKLLPKLSKMYSFDRFCVVGRFSNGETMYGRI